MKNGKTKVVVGLGKTGMSCVRYLAAQGYDVMVTDSRSNPPGLEELQKTFPNIKTSLGGFDQKLLEEAEELIVSPGVSLNEPAIAAALKKGVEAVGDIELFVRRTTTPIIAITGSNGKSTVTTLVGEMINNSGKKAGVGGNLGTPALDLLKNEADYYVLELSSFQLETTNSLHAAASVILNISQDHLDRYADIDQYLAAKQRIYTGCKVAAINLDEPACFANLKLPQKIIAFGTKQPQDGAFGIDNNYIMLGDKKLLQLDELKIKGLHNASNTLAALALGSAINLPLEAMLAPLKKFAGLPHRCQWVQSVNNVDWYNDSKGTNVGATKSAIEGLAYNNNGKIVLIAGGIGKGADFTPLRDTIAKYVRAIVLIGKDASVIERALEGSCKLIHATSMAEAVSRCAEASHAGDKVLLSPACASFDMFNNFEHRGDVFVAEVNKLAQKHFTK
jgi:UDP-N-acetylmuramoylalanine--D-glutamate ligase